MAAGVGRVTLYAHFPSREALLAAAIDQVATQATELLDVARIDDGPAPDALVRTIRAAWPTLDSLWGLQVAAGAQAATLMRHHSAWFLERLDHLVARGQAEGSFRSDLPTAWLVTAIVSLVHTAGQEVNDGRLDASVATEVLEATLLSVLAPRTDG